MQEQIRYCHCSDACPVKFKYRKCASCDKASIDQVNDHVDHIDSDCDGKTTLRGKLIMSKVN